MSKSQNTNTTHQGRLALALVAGGLVAGCGGGDKPWTVDPDGYDGIGEVSSPLLANPCTFTSNPSTMVLSVRRGETAYLTLRATDGMVVASGQTSAAAECAVPSTYKITITEDTVNPAVGNATTEKVFLDYINGTFALGSSSGQTVSPGITMTLGTGSSVVIRGSSGADKIYLGSTYNTATPAVLQYSSINVNGDTSPDVKFTGVTDVKVSTGVGADIISADGNNGTNGSALDGTITFSAYGGPDNDTLTGGKGPSTLDGGDGDDKFIQTGTVGPDTINGGHGTDTVDYSVRTAAVSVTVCTTCSTDPGGCIATNTSCHGTADGINTGCLSGALTAKGTCLSGALTAKGTCLSGALTTEGTCLSGALSTKNTCLTGPTTTKNNCLIAPAATQLSCTQTADSDLTTCLGAGTCTSEEQYCETQCSGDSTCISACQAASCTTLCTVFHDDTVTACDAAYDAFANPTTGSCMIPYNLAADPTTGTCMVPYNLAADPTTGTCVTAYNAKIDPTTGSCVATYNLAADPTTGSCVAAYNLAADPTTGSCVATRTGSYALCDAAQVTCQAGATLPFCSVCVGTGGVGDDGAAGEGDVINDDVEIVLGGKSNDTLSAFWAPCSNQASTPVLGCTLKGNEGDDTLTGSAFNDVLDGGAGNDTLIGGPGNDSLTGGAGIDTVSYADRTAQVKVSLDSAHPWTSGQNGVTGEADVIASDIENLTGGAGNDSLRGNANANIIHGGAGADTIEGGAGNDSLYGDAGDDDVYGGAGNDMLIGGTGNDHLYGGDGDDFLDSTDGAALDVVNCDGVNDSNNTAGTAPGTSDALIKDGDSSQSCEL